MCVCVSKREKNELFHIVFEIFGAWRGKDMCLKEHWINGGVVSKSLGGRKIWGDQKPDILQQWHLWN